MAPTRTVRVWGNSCLTLPHLHRVGLAVCEEEEFKCSENGLCLPDTWRCDGWYDCDSESEAPPSDEADCGRSALFIGHWCRWWRQGVVPGSKVVCWDWSTRFQCASNSSKTIYGGYVCDTNDDCGDGSDEADCSVGCASSPPASRLAALMVCLDRVLQRVPGLPLRRQVPQRLRQMQRQTGLLGRQRRVRVDLLRLRRRRQNLLYLRLRRHQSLLRRL